MQPQNKRRFTIEKLEERITPDLTLPNGHVVFAGFDNPAPGAYHPNFDRSGTAIDATMGNPTDASGLGNEGPWSAHYRSHQITCSDPACPVDPTP